MLIVALGSVGALAAGLALARPAGGSPTALTPAEKQALDIVSVSAFGEEPAGLVVTVTFKGNLQKAIGRGHLKKAAVVMILEPATGGAAEAALLTQGPGAVGQILRRTSSTGVGAVRNGRILQFFIHGPGVSNVGHVVIKTFATKPTAKSHAFAEDGEIGTIGLADLEALDRAVAADKYDFSVANALADEAECPELSSLLSSVKAIEARTEDSDARLAGLESALEREISSLTADPLRRGSVMRTWESIAARVGPFLDPGTEAPRNNAQLIAALERYLKEVKTLKRLADGLLAAEQSFSTDVQDRLAACTNSNDFPIAAGFDHKTPGNPPSEFPSTVCADFGPGGSLREGEAWDATLSDANGNTLKSAQGTISSAGTGRVVFGIPRPGTYTIDINVPAALNDRASAKIVVPDPGPPPDDRSKDCSAPPPPA